VPTSTGLSQVLTTGEGWNDCGGGAFSWEKGDGHAERTYGQKCEPVLSSEDGEVAEVGQRRFCCDGLDLDCLLGAQDIQVVPEGAGRMGTYFFFPGDPKVRPAT